MKLEDVRQEEAFLLEKIELHHYDHIAELFTKRTLASHIKESIWQEERKKLSGMPTAKAQSIIMNKYSDFPYEILWEEYISEETRAQLICQMADWLGFIKEQETMAFFK